MKAMGRCSVT